MGACYLQTVVGSRGHATCIPWLGIRWGHATCKLWLGVGGMLPVSCGWDMVGACYLQTEVGSKGGMLSVNCGWG